jgi:hypothetical protein
VSKQETKIIEGLRPLLEPGEEPLAAIVAQPKGTTKSAAGRGALGVVGAGMGGKEQRQAHASAEGAGLVLAGTACAVVLTPSRLLTVKIGAPLGFGLGGKVKEIMSWVPVSDVEGMEIKKIALRRNVTLYVRGQQIQLESNAASGVDQFQSALASLKGG